MQKGIVTHSTSLKNLTAGSLFSGIGGFDLPLQEMGVEIAWMCEKDPACRHVLGKRFEGVPIHEDIKNIGANTVAPVDLLVGGSPCQNFSVAGNRDGLAGEQSQLWYEYHRLLVELRPKWFIWENVPGVLSSGNIDEATGKRRRGIDFAIVLAGFTGIPYQIPRNGWRNSGVATGWFYNVAWRVLDAQYWGVAQRRKRVFVVGHLATTGRSPSPVLFESARMSWHYPSRKKARKETAAIAESGAIRNHSDLPALSPDPVPNPDSDSADEQDANVRVSGTLGAAHDRNRGLGNANETDLLVAQKPYSKQRFDEYDEGAGNSTLMGRDYKSPSDLVAVDLQQITSQTNRSQPHAVAPTLTPNGSVIAFAQNQRDEVRDLDDLAGALHAETGMHQQTFVAQPNSTGWDVQHARINDENDVSETLSGVSQKGGALPPIVAQSSDTEALDVRNLRSGGDVSGTLQAKESGSYSLSYQNPVRTGLRVRRLTPIETERLMGFPDNHTLLRDDGAEQSDSTRYRQTGNAVAVPVIRWIVERLLKVERGEL